MTARIYTGGMWATEASVPPDGDTIEPKSEIDRDHAWEPVMARCIACGLTMKALMNGGPSKCHPLARAAWTLKRDDHETVTAEAVPDTAGKTRKIDVSE